MKDVKLKEIVNYEELKKCIEIIHISYKKRDEQLGLNDVNNHRHSYLTYDELKDLYDKGIKMFGYYLEEKMVAFLALDFKEDELKIKDIVVMPDFQNKGIGAILLNFAKKQAQDNKKKKIILGMIYDNENLRKWYEKHGFVITNMVSYPNSTSRIGFMEYIIK